MPELIRELQIVEQSALSKTSQCCSKSVLVSVPKCWATGRPIDKSSTARSALETMNVTLTNASKPAAKLSIVDGNVQVLENVNDRALSASMSATWSVSLPICVISPIPSSVARSMSLDKTVDLSLPSSVKPVAILHSFSSATVTEKEGEVSENNWNSKRPATLLAFVLALLASNENYAACWVRVDFEGLVWAFFSACSLRKILFWLFGHSSQCFKRCRFPFFLCEPLRQGGSFFTGLDVFFDIVFPNMDWLEQISAHLPRPPFCKSGSEGLPSSAIWSGSKSRMICVIKLLKHLRRLWCKKSRSDSSRLRKDWGRFADKTWYSSTFWLSWTIHDSPFRRNTVVNWPNRFSIFEVASASVISVWRLQATMSSSVLEVTTSLHACFLWSRNILSCRPVRSS